MLRNHLLRLARAALVMPLVACPLRAQGVEGEYRPEIIVTLPPWKGVRVQLLDEQHLAMHDLAHNEHLRGVGLVSPTFRGASLTVELREVRQATGLVEHRWIPTLNTALDVGGGFELRDRARLELRDVDGAWSRRYQDRLALARPIDLFGGSSVPYVHYEVSYDTRFAVLNRREAAAGIRVPVGRGTSIDTFIMRQTDTRRAFDVLVAAGMILRVVL